MAKGTWGLIPFLRIATPTGHRGNSHKKLLQQQKKAGQWEEENEVNFGLTPYTHSIFKNEIWGFAAFMEHVYWLCGETAQHLRVSEKWGIFWRDFSFRDIFFEIYLIIWNLKLVYILITLYTKYRDMFFFFIFFFNKQLSVGETEWMGEIWIVSF